MLSLPWSRKIFIYSCITTLVVMNALYTIIPASPVHAASPTLTESKENIDAATVLFQKGITKVSPQDTAFYETMTRKNAAMLIARFATNILNTQQQDKICTFSDISTLAQVDQNDLISACKLGLFKWSAGSFFPENELTRGQLITVIARLIARNATMEKNEAYDYLLHLGIVTVDDRATSETAALRKDLYIMLHRIIVTMSQISAFSQFTNNFAVGNTNATSTVSVQNPEMQVLKIIAYRKNSVFGNYVWEQLWSAVMIAPNKIITNAHVVLDENDELLQHYEICKTETSNKKPICIRTATVDYYDSDRDLAILTIQPWQWTLPKPVTLATITPRNGDTIDVRGYPGIWGNSITFTKGVISGIEKDKYKSDVKIDHGNSWGWAFNKKWELVGVPNSAQEDTDTLAYIIPYDTVKAFLNKEWEITMNNDTKVDTNFASYISDVQKQKIATSITTPLFTLPSIWSFSFDDYSFDSAHGLYAASLSSQDSTTTINIQTVQFTDPKVQNAGDEKAIKTLSEYCSTFNTGTTTIDNHTWEYIECEWLFGGKNMFHSIDTSISSGAGIEVTMQSESSNKKVKEEATSIIEKISLNKSINNKPISYSINSILTLPTVANFALWYTMNAWWDIDITGMLWYGWANDTKVDINVREISSKEFWIYNKINTFSEHFSNDRMNDYYDITLTGSTVTTTQGATIYLAWTKDKAEDIKEWDTVERTLKANTIILYNNKIYNISLSFNYEWDQNTQKDTDILAFIDKLMISGKVAFDKLWDTPKPLSQITIGK